MKEGPSGPYFEGNAALCPNQGGGQNAQRSHFAAIAISEDDIMVWGSSWGWPTKSSAERRALQNCKAKDCKIRMWGEGACIALAESDDAGYWGTGPADSPGGAERDAVGMCQGAAKHPCKVVTHPCSED